MIRSPMSKRCFIEQFGRIHNVYQLETQGIPHFLLVLFLQRSVKMRELIRNLWILCRTEHIWLYFGISPIHRPVSCASVLVKGSASRI